MCDGVAAMQTFSKAFSSIGIGNAEALSYRAGEVMADARMIDARSRTNLEVAQMEAVRTLASAQKTNDMGALNRMFGEQARVNASAMAVSGLDPVSFTAVTEGNEQELKRNERALHTGAMQRDRTMRLETSERKIAGQAEERSYQWEKLMMRQRGAAARYTGWTGANAAIYEGFHNLDQIGWRGLFGTQGAGEE
jgi:hypothetical protein